MQSKTNLFMVLDTIFNKDFEFYDAALEHPMIENETFGRRSYIYILNKTQEARAALEEKLRLVGFTPSNDYGPAGSITEVQVKYFKGFHWDE